MTDYSALAEKWLRETPDGAQALDALGRLLVAREAEEVANSDKARSKAQSDGLRASDDMAAATGEKNLRRCRMLAHAHGLPNGAKVDVSEFERLVREWKNTLGGKVWLRHLLGRHVQDTASTLGERVAGLLAMDLIHSSSGRDGVLTGTIKTPGRDPRSGPAFACRLKTIVDAGYTLGAEHGGGRAPFDLWARAARAYNEAATRLRVAGFDVKDVTAQTVRDWVARNVDLGGGSPKAGDLFNQAKAEGAAARELPDPSRILPP